MSRIASQRVFGNSGLSSESADCSSAIASAFSLGRSIYVCFLVWNLPLTTSSIAKSKSGIPSLVRAEVATTGIPKSRERVRVSIVI